MHDEFVGCIVVCVVVFVVCLMGRHLTQLKTMSLKAADSEILCVLCFSSSSTLLHFILRRDLRQHKDLLSPV